MPVLLDGGTGHALKLRGVASKLAPETQDYFMAGALANIESPETVVQVHRDFVDAGCDVITTNSYVATPFNVDKFDLQSRLGASSSLVSGRNILDLLLESACRNAAQGIASSSTSSSIRRQTPALPTVQIAASLPPLAESYQCANLPPLSTLLETYSYISRIVVPRCNILLCETMSTCTEALAAVTASQPHNVPVWCSFTLRDDSSSRLRDGTPLDTAVSSLLSAKLDINAILLNCSSPSSVSSALSTLSVPPHITKGAYANGFSTTTSEWLGEPVDSYFTPELESEYKDGLITPESYAAWAERWVAHGAGIVGGCCGILPEHMRAVVQRLRPLN